MAESGSGYQAAACSCLHWAVAGAGLAVVAIHAGTAHLRICDSLLPALAQVPPGDPPRHQLNVKTAGYPAGTYTLSFTADSDPTTHTAQFVVS